jgi:hypothetical protein
MQQHGLCVLAFCLDLVLLSMAARPLELPSGGSPKQVGVQLVASYGLLLDGKGPAGVRLRTAGSEGW